MRHKGFIPWDDDIDIGLFRNDYNKLIECCKTDLDVQFFLQTRDTDSDYWLGYAKVRINGTEFIEKFYEKSKMHQGIFIDIFPLDNISDSTLLAKLQFYIVKILSRAILYKYKRNLSINSILFQTIFSPIILFCSNKIILNWADKIISITSKKRTKHVISFFTGYKFKKQFFNKTVFGNAKMLLFENLEVPVPEKYHTYLLQLFGDYMKLPSEKNRVGHHVLKVTFDG